MLDAEPLRAWLVANVAGVQDGPMETELISGGASNLTYVVRVGPRELVVRRPPVGAFLPSANDMGREYRYLSALAPTPVPTPVPLGYCEDESVTGAPFYVMERVHGVVPHDPTPLAGLTADEGRRLSERFIEVLVDLHDVDIDAVGLGQAAKRTGYLERQVTRWVEQWHRASDGVAHPVIDELALNLERGRPESPPTTVVHGDYRLGNVMVDTVDRTRIVGVFDWEMATLGDPLADLGYTLLYWGSQDRPLVHPSQKCADLPGFLTGSELVEYYAKLTGRDTGPITFYVVLAAFKLTIISAGNRARLRRTGADTSGGGDELPLAEWALDLWKRSGV